MKWISFLASQRFHSLPASDFISCQSAISFLAMGDFIPASQRFHSLPASDFIPCQPVISFLASQRFHFCQPAIFHYL
jgi:hypothetical protein